MLKKIREFFMILKTKKGNLIGLLEHHLIILKVGK